MTNFEIIILSVAMSIDAFIVCLSYGLIINKNRLKNSLMLSIAFGFFQFLMPVLGAGFISLPFFKFEIISKWIVFSIFLILALKFIQSSFNKKEESQKKCISLFCIFCLSIATSIDAFAAGINLELTQTNILASSLSIGIITFIDSFTGFWISSPLKKIPTAYLERIGAALLIYLAIHTVL